MTNSDQAPAAPPATPPALPGDAPPAARSSELWDNVRFLTGLALIVLIFRSFFISPFNIPSESMQPRLLIGDYLLVNKMAYGYSRHSLPVTVPLLSGRLFAATPHRGDVAVFSAPPGNVTPYIKRVIGLPGDTIEVRGGALWLNGVAVPRQPMADLVIPVTANMVSASRASFEYPCFRPDFEEVAEDGTRQCRYPRYRETLPGGKSYEILDLVDSGADNFAPVTVPDGHLFMMGDNRDRSADSRFPAVEGQGIGLVPMENLVGRALVTMFSTDGSASLINPISWFTAARWDRAGEGF